MVRSRWHSWRLRPRRARIADVALVGVILLVAVAIVANAPATIHDTKRGRLDLKVMKGYLKAHPELGTFGYPVQSVHHKHDYACAFHHHTHQGVCIEIADRTVTSTEILHVWNCVQSLKPLQKPLPGPGDRVCPIAAAKAI